MKCTRRTTHTTQNVRRTARHVIPAKAGIQYWVAMSPPLCEDDSLWTACRRVPLAACPPVSVDAKTRRFLQTDYLFTSMIRHSGDSSRVLATPSSASSVPLVSFVSSSRRRRFRKASRNMYSICAFTLRSSSLANRLSSSHNPWGIRSRNAFLSDITPLVAYDQPKQYQIQTREQHAGNDDRTAIPIAACRRWFADRVPLAACPAVFVDPATASNGLRPF
jgi:hypothetical protein